MSETTQNRGFKRKLIYIGILIVLLLPLSYLGQPSRFSQGVQGQADERDFQGYLSKLREEHELSQTSIGDIDPSGATMQMLLFGFNGLAVNQLWGQAQEAQKTEDWESLRAILEQVVKLQPHYFKVWDYLAHNQIYNMSVEFDDYRARYKQVVTGFNFMKQGIDLNKKEPRLPHKLAWYIGHKIGRADERVFYRRLFRDDYMKLFHEGTPENPGDKPDRRPEDRDNWLVAKEKFKFATEMADELAGRGIPLQTTPSLFYKEYSHAQINYSEAMAEDGRFDLTRGAWKQAAADFRDYSFDRTFLTPNSLAVRVGELEELRREAGELRKELIALVPGGMDKLYEERMEEINKVDPSVVAALRKPYPERTQEESDKASKFEARLQIGWQEVADRAPDGPDRTRAKLLASRITTLDERIKEIDLLRDPLNYDYWKLLIQAQQEDDAYEAYKTTFEAKKLLKGKPYEAAKMYEQAFCHWRALLNKYPALRNNNIMADDVNEIVKNYRTALSQAELDFPENFILRDIVAMIDDNAAPESLPFPPLCGQEDKGDPKPALPTIDTPPPEIAPDAEKKPEEAKPAEAPGEKTTPATDAKSPAAAEKAAPATKAPAKS